MDLARELTLLDVDWPETPELRLDLAPRRRRWWIVAVALAAIVAIAAAFAVPQSRGAILRFFHLGAAHVEVVETLPPAEQRPLEAGLGQVVSLPVAEHFFDPPLLLPPGPTPRLHNPFENVVAMVFNWQGEPVLLSEFDDVGYFKKIAGIGNIEHLSLDSPDKPAIWIHGPQHEVFFPGASPRLAGNTLIWVWDGATYRLEGKGLTRESALELAKRLSPP